MAKPKLFLGSAVKGARMLPNAAAMPHLDQGSSNACGTTSLAMAMTYLGVPKIHQQIDRDIRRMDIFTSPDQLVRYARERGLEAEGYNSGSFEMICSHIDLGHPCICIIDANYDYPNPPYHTTISGLHYIVVVGYGKDPNTGTDCFVFHDPNAGDDQAAAQVGVDVAALLADFGPMWDEVGWGFHSYFFALAKKGSYLPISVDDGVEATTATLDGVARLTNGLSQFVKPHGFGDWLGAVPNIVSGIVETIVGGVGALIGAAGDWINRAVDGIPVVRNIVKPIGDVLKTVGAVLGDLANGLGAVTDDLNSAVNNLTSGNIGAAIGDVAQAAGDAAQSVANAIGDAVSGAADAVSDFFSGW